VEVNLPIMFCTSQGARNWPFFTLTGLPVFRCSDEKVRLPAKKGRDLDDIEDFCGGPYLLDGMDVGNYRYSDPALDFLQAVSTPSQCPVP